MSEEQVADGYGGYDTCQVGEQATSDGMTGMAYAYTAEIYGENIGGGIG